MARNRARVGERQVKVNRKMANTNNQIFAIVCLRSSRNISKVPGLAAYREEQSRVRA